MQTLVVVRRALLAGAALLAATPALVHSSTGSAELVGRESAGVVRLPTGQRIHPAGLQIERGGSGPTAVAVAPGGGLAAVNDPLRLVDPATVKVLDSGPGVISYSGLAFSADGRTLYASDGNAGSVVALGVAGGRFTGARRDITIAPDDEGRSPYPGGLALSADGSRLFVALRTQNALGVVDLGTGSLTRTIPVGNAPHSVVVLGATAYVTNEGGRPAVDGDFTNLSAGTPIVADRFTGGAATGTVSVVDLDAGRVTTDIAVGLHPTAMLADEGLLWVTETTEDRLRAIDVRTRETVARVDLRAAPGAPPGTAPNALTALPGHRLAVTLGRANAVAIVDTERGLDKARALRKARGEDDAPGRRDARGGRGPKPRVGFIPVGWFPSAVGWDPAAERLVVANLQGVGSLADADAGRAVRSVGGTIGSVSVVPEPTPARLRDWTAEVVRLNRWSRLSARPDGPAAKVFPDRMLERSPVIKHVVYIVKENRTYDQVLGDDTRGNGDASLAAYGRSLTPNHHALARQFPLLDNCYVSGRASNDGHQWAMAASNSDYFQRQRGPRPTVSPPSSGFDALLYTRSGYLWENALRHGRTIEDFGEFTVEDSFTDAYSDIPSLQPFVVPQYRGYNLAYPDQGRAAVFLSRFAQHVAQGDLPDLTMMILPNDHTGSIVPGLLGPEAYMADNDLALGTIVGAITQSPFWKDTAIFIVEDDAQGGPDHVDGHRTLCYAISPYARHGVVDSTLYTQVDMVRTIEDLLGLPPMNPLDAAATPMRSAFTDVPDPSTYTPVAVDPAVLTRRNPPLSALTGIRRRWARAMAREDFTHLDQVDERLQRRSLFYAATGFRRAFPGDPRVLEPFEALRVDEADEDEEEEEEER